MLEGEGWPVGHAMSAGRLLTVSRHSTVLLCTMDYAPFIFMYQPVLQTLQAGFEALGTRVRVLFGQRNVWPHSYRLEAGDLLVWIGMAGSDFGLIRWKKLRARGVRTAWYNSEPALDDATLAPRCLRSYVGALNSVDEIWDYSLFNLHTCRNAVLNRTRLQKNQTAVLRYVPPGMMELNVTAPTPAPAVDRAMFVGILPSNSSDRRNWKAGFLQRGACFAQLEQQAGGRPTHPIAGTPIVWSARDCGSSVDSCCVLPASNLSHYVTSLISRLASCSWDAPDSATRQPSGRSMRSHGFSRITRPLSTCTSGAARASTHPPRPSASRRCSGRSAYHPTSRRLPEPVPTRACAPRATTSVAQRGRAHRVRAGVRARRAPVCRARRVYRVEPLR